MNYLEICYQQSTRRWP